MKSISHLDRDGISLALCGEEFLDFTRVPESGTQRGDRTPDQLGVNEPLYR